MGKRWFLRTSLTFLLCVLHHTARADLGDSTFAAYPSGLSYDDSDLLNKRTSRFIRIGRGLSSFIRIGRDSLAPGLYDVVEGGENDIEDGVADEIEGTDDSDSYGRSEIYPRKRISSFVRIGRGGKESNVDLQYSTFNKRGGAFMRMGKFPSPGFRRWRNRAQLTDQPYYRRTGRIGHSFIRIGKRDTSDAMQRMLEVKENDQGLTEQDIENLQKYLGLYEDEGGATGEQTTSMDEEDKRISSFVRIGREPGDEHYMQRDDAKEAAKRISSFVRIGRPFEYVPVKRHSSFVRIGRTALWGLPFRKNKRVSSFVRIGKSGSASDDVDKRMSSFVRIGKSGLDKRPFVPIGKNLDDQTDMNNDFRRAHAFVRIGKGDRVDRLLDDNSEMKRAHAFVRIGKATGKIGDGYDKRAHAFVRIGKSIGETVNEYEKRAHAFVRMGKSDIEPHSDEIHGTNKRMHSFVRIGKSIDDGQEDKRISSFVRIGKRSDPAFDGNNTVNGPPEYIPANDPLVGTKDRDNSENTYAGVDNDINHQQNQANSGEHIVYIKAHDTEDTDSSVITK